MWGCPGEAQVLDTMETYQEEIQTPLDATKAKLAATREASVVYQRELMLNKERLELLPRVQRISAWANDRMAFFGKGEYGEYLAEVAALLSAFESFAANYSVHKEVNDALFRLRVSVCGSHAPPLSLTRGRPCRCRPWSPLPVSRRPLLRPPPRPPGCWARQRSTPSTTSSSCS